MLKQISYENWKSFHEATLYIDPLTVMIGTNASGKSNALDGLTFLNRVTLGKEIATALDGDSTIAAIRGGVEWAALKPNTQFTLATIVQGEDDLTEYLYTITIELRPRVQLQAESLTRHTYDKKTPKKLTPTPIFLTDETTEDSLRVSLFNGKGVRRVTRTFRRSTTILSQIQGQTLREDVNNGIKAVIGALQHIFILDPVPSLMRTFSALADNLQNNAANIAGVLAALPAGEKQQVEATLSHYVTHLPERDIQRVWAEPVGRFQTDAMLYCEELWLPDQPPTTIDSRGMSDGTLRFLAILTALLTRPKESLLVIEEIDNGLHPSRAALLLRMLHEIGQARGIDILLTTHNPALLDALHPEMMPFVVVTHRDPETGESQLTLLEDLANLPKLLSFGSLGGISTKGLIERSLSSDQ